MIGFDVIGFEEALARVEAAARALPGEEVPLAEAHGRVLAEPVHAAIPSPRGDVSAMDGYALRAADATVGAALRVIGECLAGGAPPPPVGPGEAVRIFTGAAMPPGADTVVMQENCEASDGAMRIARPFGPGRHVRAMGSDFAAGDVLLPAGRRLDARAMVALAGADRATVRVHTRVRVAIIATGDELAAPGTARDRPQAIPESVSFGVAALVAEQGGTVVARYTGADALPALERTAGDALGLADLVVVAGGASVGERDFAKPMFAAHGLETIFAKVAIKPGKPVWLGRCGQVLVMGLPGNPTSAMVTARLLLVPLLAGLHGADQRLAWRNLPLAQPLPATGERESFVRAAWAAAGLVPLSNQDSGAQAALAEAQWLIRCPPGQRALRSGAEVAALAF